MPLMKTVPCCPLKIARTYNQIKTFIKTVIHKNSAVLSIKYQREREREGKREREI